MSKKFNEEDTLKFVQLYREHECLWDKRCDAYKNKEMRATALEQLRVGMNIEGLTINEVKSKIKSIRNTYYLELDKIEKSSRSGAGGSVYKPKAKWFDEYDSFVKPVSIRRKTIDNMDIPNNNEPGSSNSNESGPSLVPRSENGENDSGEETPRFIPPTKPKRSKLPQISNMINDLREIKDNTCVEETELDLFGKSVSAQLKKLSEEQAVIAKEKIQSILTQCRLTDIRAKNAYSYQMPQSVQRLQNTLPTNWNSTQVLSSYIEPQYSLPTTTICPSAEPSPSTCSSSCSQYTNTVSPQTPYNYESYDENVANSDVIQQAFGNA